MPIFGDRANDSPLVADKVKDAHSGGGGDDWSSHNRRGRFLGDLHWPLLSTETVVGSYDEMLPTSEWVEENELMNLRDHMKFDISPVQFPLRGSTRRPCRWGNHRMRIPILVSDLFVFSEKNVNSLVMSFREESESFK